ncbi:MAG: hypothetical protein AABY10_00645 [Nanoarchaeota archaeon]
MFVNKKTIGFAFVSLIFLSLFVGVVSAQTPDEVTPDEVTGKINTALKYVLAFFKPLVVFLIGDTGTPGELTIKVLAFFLTLVIIWGTLSTFKFINTLNPKANTALNFAIGLIIATIGVRFMPDNLLTSLTAPSSAFVVVLFLGIPFIAFYFITKDKPIFLQQLMWFMFAFLIGVISIYNTFLTTNTNIKTAYQMFGWIHIAFALSALALGIYGGHIGRWVRTGQDLNALSKYDSFLANKLMAEIAELRKDSLQDGITDDAKESIMKGIGKKQKEYESLLKNSIKEGKPLGGIWMAFKVLGVIAIIAGIVYVIWFEILPRWVK